MSSEEQKSFISDVHLGVGKIFNLKRNQLQVGLGFSLMNNGSDYYYNEKFLTPTGDTLLFESNSDFRYNSFDLLLGYQVSQFSFELINRFSMNHKFNDTGELLLPEFKIGYTIKLKRKTIF